MTAATFWLMTVLFGRDRPNNNSVIMRLQTSILLKTELWLDGQVIHIVVILSRFSRGRVECEQRIIIIKRRERAPVESTAGPLAYTSIN